MNTARISHFAKQTRLALRIGVDGGANQVSQRLFIDGVVLAEVDGAGRFSVEAGVEKALRVGQRSAFEEVDLDVLFEGSEGNDVAVVGPDGGAPFPVFVEVGVGFVNERSEFAHSRPAPVGEVGDLLVDFFRRGGHWRAQWRAERRSTTFELCSTAGAGGQTFRSVRAEGGRV